MRGGPQPIPSVLTVEEGRMSVIADTEGEQRTYHRSMVRPEFTVDALRSSQM